jgi:hypothetical protein
LKGGKVVGQEVRATEVTPFGPGDLIGTSETVRYPRFSDDFDYDKLDIKREALKVSLRGQGWEPIPDYDEFFTSPSADYSLEVYEYSHLSENDYPEGGIFRLTPDEAERIHRHEDYEALWVHLQSEGWEPIPGESNSADFDVPVILFTRRVGADKPTAAPGTGDPLEALRKLGELRDAGVVTEEEFQAKKKELLAAI